MVQGIAMTADTCRQTGGGGGSYFDGPHDATGRFGLIVDEAPLVCHIQR